MTKNKQKSGHRVPEIGFVIIGRNEGERLRRCVDSIIEQILKINRQDAELPLDTKDGYRYPVIYVDSGSTDGSVKYAQSAGCSTLTLDTAKPFTAARARNEGLRALSEKYPEIEWIQFIDGDCSLQPGWLAKASLFLKVNPSAAIVCGRRREIYPQKSIYNTLCDMEWDTQSGEVQACGGDFLARKKAILEVHAFNPTMIAGEEPEMCYRLRKNKWTIWRIREEMTLHDANMTTFKQFWIRSSRAGFAYAERWFMHSTKTRPYCFREVTSICLWGGIIPILTAAAATLSPSLALIMASVYPLMGLRIFLKKMKLRNTVRKSISYSIFTQIGKFPQFVGVMRFMLITALNKNASLIEYK